jgi:hypothetical protein
MAASRYRALTEIGGGNVLHLVREDAEASLCGVPSSVLDGGGVSDPLVCPTCIEWLPKRMAVSARYRRAEAN